MPIPLEMYTVVRTQSMNPIQYRSIIPYKLSYLYIYIYIYIYIIIIFHNNILGGAGVGALFSGPQESKRASRKRSRASSRAHEIEEDQMQCLPCVGVAAELIVNDGRKCGGCCLTDKDTDPVDPSITRVFGRGKRSLKTGKWMDRQCWYCLRIFEGRFRKEYVTFEKWNEARGVDPELHDRVAILLRMLIDKCKLAGKDYVHKTRMDWAEADNLAKMELVKKQRLQIEDVPDILIPVDEYQGDLAGRQIMWHGGVKKVMVPSTDYAKVRRSTIIDVNTKMDLGDNRLAIAGDDMALKATNAMSQFDIPRATGPAMPSM